MNVQCLAFDLGASGGRLLCGAFDGNRLTVSELHRFENEMVRMNGVLYWDIFRLFAEMKKGLAKAAAAGVTACSVGIDTWGVDYALIDKDNNIIGLPIAYRDDRTDACIAEADALCGLDRIYGTTGIQLLSFNTLFQLMADKKMRPAAYHHAERLMFMPDLLGFLMTGHKYNEYTIMSTGQVLDAHAKKPAPDILGGLGLRNDLFCDMVMPGTRIGALSTALRLETGQNDMELIAVGSHDTASAVAGTPFAGSDSAFLSCGTWSLLGMEVPAPIISADSYKENFTNEGGVEGSIRFLKNINGLWIIQQLRKCFGNISYAEIADAARAALTEAPDLCGLAIDPNDKCFIAPIDMRAEIEGYCEEHGARRPNGLGMTALAVYNGLAREYGLTVNKLEKLTGRNINCINMIGGGIRDTFLCELTARVTGKEIITGPIEGSVFGNIIIQLISKGEVGNLSQGRQIIASSCERRVFRPH